MTGGPLIMSTSSSRTTVLQSELHPPKLQRWTWTSPQDTRARQRPAKTPKVRTSLGFQPLNLPLSPPASFNS